MKGSEIALLVGGITIGILFCGVGVAVVVGATLTTKVAVSAALIGAGITAKHAYDSSKKAEEKSEAQVQLDLSRGEDRNANKESRINELTLRNQIINQHNHQLSELVTSLCERINELENRLLKTMTTTSDKRSKKIFKPKKIKAKIKKLRNDKVILETQKSEVSNKKLASIIKNIKFLKRKLEDDTSNIEEKKKHPFYINGWYKDVDMNNALTARVHQFGEGKICALPAKSVNELESLFDQLLQLGSRDEYGGKSLLIPVRISADGGANPRNHYLGLKISLNQDLSVNKVTITDTKMNVDVDFLSKIMEQIHSKFSFAAQNDQQWLIAKIAVLGIEDDGSSNGPIIVENLMMLAKNIDHDFKLYGRHAVEARHCQAKAVQSLNENSADNQRNLSAMSM